MSINNAKHIVGEIENIRCTIVETGATLEREAFLRDLLELNGFEVKEMQEASEAPADETKFTIGVTDLVFNPVYSIYECLLKTREGQHVTPGYWKQECIDCNPWYWIKRKTARKSTND